MSGASTAVMALAQAYASTGGGGGGGGIGGISMSRPSRVSTSALGSGPNDFYSTTTASAATGAATGAGSVSASGEAVARPSASFGASGSSAGSRASVSGRFSSPPPQLRLGLGLGLAGAPAAALGPGAVVVAAPAAPHSGGATAREAAAALAAVRALEGRYGSAVAPDEELLALEQEAAFRDRSVRMQEVSFVQVCVYDGLVIATSCGYVQSGQRLTGAEGWRRWYAVRAPTVSPSWLLVGAGLCSRRLSRPPTLRLTARRRRRRRRRPTGRWRSGPS